MPCDWNVARKHALARRTAPDTKVHNEEDDDVPMKRIDKNYNKLKHVLVVVLKLKEKKFLIVRISNH